MKCKKILAITLILIFFIIFSTCMYLLLKDFKDLAENNKSTDILIEETIKVNEETQEKNID